MSERLGELRCPACGGHDVRTSSRGGVLDSLFGFFRKRPFRCRGCHRRFYRHVPERAVPAPPSPGGTQAP